MAVRVSYLNGTSLAGLSWQRMPTRLSEKSLGLRWDRVFASVDDADLIGLPSLVSQILAGVAQTAQTATLLIAYADAASGVYLGAVTAGGRPLIEPERLFANSEGLVAWLKGELAQGDVEGLVASPDVLSQLDTGIAQYPIEPHHADANVIRVTGRPSQRVALFDSIARNKSRQMQLGIGLLVCVGVGLGAFLFFQSSRTTVPVAEAVVVPTVYEVREEMGFLRACASRFGAPWSVAPGWAVTAEGCVARGMEDTSGLLGARDAVAYKTYRLKPGYDASLAARALEVVVAETEDTSVLRRSDTEITLLRPVVAAFERTSVLGERFDGNMLRAVEDAYLGLARKVVGAGDAIQVDLWGDFTEATEPLGDLPWAEVKSVVRREGLITLFIGQRSPRLVPVTEINS